MSYAGDYEASLHASPTFVAWADKLAQELIERHGLGGKRILELGCGRGEFLGLFAGHCEPIGFDQSFDPERVPAAPGVRIESRYFAPDQDPERGELVISRHVLEHVPDPVEHLRLLLGACAEPGALYLEVPSGGFLLEQLALWDLIYEHVSYFTPASLSRALLDACARIERMESCYGEQFLAAECRPAPSLQGAPDSPQSWIPLAERFAVAFAQQITREAERLSQARARRIAIWGAGSKGATYCNLVPGAASIDCVIDRNPRKHGHHVSGTGQRILSPEEACARQLDLVLVMNPLYVDEIRDQLRELGQEPELHCPLQPANG
jgi:SAM-dependent methyltransferase